LIVFAQVTYDEDEENTKRCVEGIRPYVDRAIIIHDGTLSKEMLDWLTEKKCDVYEHPWQDSTSIQRNEYLKRLNSGDWCIVSDPDEQYDRLACEQIRRTIASAEEKALTRLSINCHDCWVKEDGTTEENVSNHYKPLIFKYTTGVRYIGIIHEALTGEWIDARLHSKWFYRHIKTHATVWRNAVRNMYCSGGGDNFIGNPYWLELRQITTSLGINDWKALYRYLKKGDIDPKLKEWIIKYKDLDKEPWHSEIREWYLWYFKVLHPEEAPTKEELEVGHWGLQPPVVPKGGLAEFMVNLRNTYREYLKREPSKCELDYWWGRRTGEDLMIEDVADLLMDPQNYPPQVYVAQQYQEILGREVDASGFHTYSTLISEGQVKREDLPNMLRRSPEGRKIAPPIAPTGLVGLTYEEGGIQKHSEAGDIFFFISEVFRMCSLMVQGKVRRFTFELGSEKKEEEMEE